jgi:hypothetical protein
MPTRGERLNNPGNIRHATRPWFGQSRLQPDPDFVNFNGPEYGIRAIVKTLLTYQTADGCKTIRQIIDRWAPPNENDTAAYIADVAQRCHVTPEQTIDAHDPEVMTALVEAIIRHENGEQPYPDATIAQALSLAGIGPTPPEPPALAKAA